MRTLVITNTDLESHLNQRTHSLVEYLTGVCDEVVVARRISSDQVKKKWQCIFYIHKKVYMKAQCISIIPFSLPLFTKNLQLRSFFMALAIKFIYKKPFDICITEAPWPGSVGVWLKRLNGAKTVVYEDLDLFEGFYTVKTKELEYIRKMEHTSLKKSDIIICVGNELKKLRSTQSTKPIHVVPNGVDYKLFNQAFKHPQKSTNEFVLVYIGSIEKWSGIELAIKSLPRLVEYIPKIRLDIIGKSNDEAYLKRLNRLVAKLRIADKVNFIGQKNYKELPDYLSKAHIGIATFEPIDLMKYAFTLKIIEYMAAGLPVVATAIGETKWVIESSKAGLSINHQVNDFVAAVVKLYNNKDLYQEFITNGVNYAKSYDWKELYESEMKFICKTVNERCNVHST